jgi:hypothetical protein
VTNAPIATSAPILATPAPILATPAPILATLAPATGAPIISTTAAPIIGTAAPVIPATTRSSSTFKASVSGDGIPTLVRAFDFSNLYMRAFQA